MGLIRDKVASVKPSDVCGFPLGIYYDNGQPRGRLIFWPAEKKVEFIGFDYCVYYTIKTNDPNVTSWNEVFSGTDAEATPVKIQTLSRGQAIMVTEAGTTIKITSLE